MQDYRAEIRSPAADAIRHLPPGVKRAVREAIAKLSQDPAAGEPLHGELQGRFRFRVRRYRIVYRIDRKRRVIHIIAVGHRRSVYEELAELQRQGAKE